MNFFLDAVTLTGAVPRAGVHQHGGQQRAEDREPVRAGVPGEAGGHSLLTDLDVSPRLDVSSNLARGFILLNVPSGRL